jgi:hypothetical protein
MSTLIFPRPVSGLLSFVVATRPRKFARPLFFCHEVLAKTPFPSMGAQICAAFAPLPLPGGQPIHINSSHKGAQICAAFARTVVEAMAGLNGDLQGMLSDVAGN